MHAAATQAAVAEAVAEMKTQMSVVEADRSKLAEELERSTQAFNLFRARANTALKKTAAEQLGADERTNRAVTELEEQRASATEHEATHRRQLDEWRMKLADSERRVEELKGELSSA